MASGEGVRFRLPACITVYVCRTRLSCSRAKKEATDLYGLSLGFRQYSVDAGSGLNPKP